MSQDGRSCSAPFKRAEQLKRWEESETNRESSALDGKTRKIKFPPGCVFLAACASGDKEEVLRLLKKGADIGTTNVDGLSALHQACIDDNLDMVEFLIEHGADINKGDNEGWTPLHATASCGFMSIAKYLIEHGANVAAVNNDGELPVDIAESDEMEDMLQQQIDDRGIDADDARNEEERLMLSDAKNWLMNGTEDKLHPKTGATALHVAAAKGYIKVMDILLQAGLNVDAQDFDGWTPLHAAAHWGQREACEILVEHLCNMDMKNCVGQTAFDVAEGEIVRVLEDLRKKQASMSKEHIINKTQNNNKLKSPVEKKPVITDSLPIENEKVENEDIRRHIPEVPKVEVEIKPVPSENESRVESDDDLDSLSTETSDTNSVGISDISDEEMDVEKKNRANRDDSDRNSKIVNQSLPNRTVPNNPAPTVPPSKQVAVDADDVNVPSWRRSGSLRSRGADSSKPPLTLRIGEKEGTVTPKSPSSVNPVKTDASQEVVLRRTQSFEADEKFYRRYLELRAKINAGNSCPTLHSTPTRSASLKEKHYVRKNQTRDEIRGTIAISVGNATIPTSPVPVSPTSPSQQQPNQVRRSFVPPVRDEESETQRKAHAKRVRETRRSTQGVTLEEIKSAEQLVKKKQQQMQQSSNQINSNEQQPAATGTAAAVAAEDVVVNVHKVVERIPAVADTVSATFTRNSEGGNNLGEKRPSWRLKVDNGSKFMLEDARNSNEQEVGHMRRAVVTPVTETGDTTVTIPLRRNRTEEKVQDKENDTKTAQATQAVIQRRKRPKRRSTGVPLVGMDDLDPDKNSETPGDGAYQKLEESATVNSTIRMSYHSSSARRGTYSPRPSSLYGPSTNLSLLGYSGMSQSSPYLNSVSNYSPSYSTYGGTSSGYGGISIPNTASALSSPSLYNSLIQGLSSRSSSPSYSKRSSYSPHYGSPTSSRYPSRSSSFNRHTPYSSASKLSSTSSLVNSEGYESGAEKSVRSSVDVESSAADNKISDSATENGEIDYKKLYEESCVENERLREKLRHTEEDLAQAKTQAEKNAILHKNSLSEVEKRERRAMERKLSEMEEELKQLEQLKCENQRLKDENGALIRVISKLSK